MKKVLFFSLFLIYLTLIAIPNFKFSEEIKIPIVGKKLFIDYLYIPAVVGDKGVLTKFYLEVFRGNGKVFLSIPPLFDQKSILSFLFAKEAACKIVNNCNNYTYLFYTDDVTYAEGFSGTAGFSVLILSFFFNRTKNYPITGFMLPNGIVAPVSGINKKLQASLKISEYLVAPAEGKRIISAYTILDLLKIYFNKTYNITFAIPKKYYEIIKNITLDICKDVNNPIVKGLLIDKRYYSAASYCFREKSEKFKINLTNRKIDRLIERLEDEIKEYKCHTYECEEIKYQILERLNIAKNLSGNKKYWRYYTALGWKKFLEIANNITRKNTCNIINEEYRVIRLLYENLPETNNCFKKREYLARIYSSLVTYRNEKALYSILNLTKFYLSKNGFSITAYNYLQYAEDLYKLDEKDSAFYYAILALEYAI